MDPITGLHHVTAIASDPQRNLDFYTQVLGLRFVKKTVNFDDPGTYHFYFGDDAGSPGTILTFFPWANSRKGKVGAGETNKTAFSVPVASLGYWKERLTAKGVAFTESTRFQETLLTIQDPDGMGIELVGHDETYEGAGEIKAPRYADVPAEHSIRGFFGVTLVVRQGEGTIATLETMGFKKVDQHSNIHRFSAAGNALGNHIDVVVDPNAPWGQQGAGSVHHIAFRSTSDASQLEWQKELSKTLHVTPVQDRNYFHSIYFREPGGVLFELATNPPGFAIDEPAESLGEALKLPAQYEQYRGQLEEVLPKLVLHKATAPESVAVQA